MSKPTFVMIEGGEGSGKSTLIENLEKKYPGALFTREPGGTPMAEELRELLITNELDDEAALWGFFCARFEHVKKLILPALREGRDVFTDRFSLSTYAYQVFGSPDQAHHEAFDFAQQRIMEMIHEYATVHLVMLWVDPVVGLERACGRGEDLSGFDQADLPFHQKVFAGMREGINEHFYDYENLELDTGKLGQKEVFSQTVNFLESLKAAA